MSHDLPYNCPVCGTPPASAGGAQETPTGAEQICPMCYHPFDACSHCGPAEATEHDPLCSEGRYAGDQVMPCDCVPRAGHTEAATLRARIEALPRYGQSEFSDNPEKVRQMDTGIWFEREAVLALLIPTEDSTDAQP